LIEPSEAFVYLWYDGPNDMYYLGSHLGTPDDTYTHSSTIWEHFTKDNIPEGVTREILAAGTEEEMHVLESKLLKHIRNLGVWDKYYNDNLPDLDLSDDETFWTWCRKAEERKKERQRERDRSPQRKVYEKKRRQDPKRKAYSKRKNAEYRARKKSERQGLNTVEAFL
jgi:hypothetical protein